MSVHEPAGAKSAEHRVTADDGIRLYLQQRGRGPALLVLHGLGYATWAVEPLTAHLADRFTIFSLDTRGAGRSDKPTGPYSIDRFAQDAHCALQRILEVTGGAPGGSVHLLGYSMGGYTAQVLTLWQPQLVRTLTLLSTSAGGPAASDVPLQTRAAWERHATLPAEAFARATMPISLAHDWPRTHLEHFERLLTARLRHPTPQHAWQAQYDASAAFLRDGCPAEQIAVPTLVVHGDEDRVVPVENGRQLHDRIPGSTYVEVSGGHLIHLEAPAHIARLVTDFTSAAASSASTTPYPRHDNH